MSKRLPLFASLAFVSVLIPAATAQAITIFGASIPCSTGWDCTLCAGVALIQNFINFAIIIAFPVAAILFAYAGGLMMTSAANPSGIKKSQDIFKTVGIGFAFVLCGWLVVDTILHTLVINPNPGFFPNHTWNTVGQCVDRTNQTSKMVGDLLRGLFAPNNPNNTPVTAIGGITCPAGSTQAGNGCAVGNGGQGYVPPVGYTCSEGTFDSNSGGCQVCTIGGCDIIAMTPPAGSGTWNGSVPASNPQTCGGASCSATASSDGQTVTYTNADGTQTTLQGGTLPWRNNNPGDIQYGTFATQHGAIGQNGRWAVFPDYATGAAAEVSLLQTSTYQSLTVAGAVNRLAPSFENNTSQITTNVANAIGVSPSTSMSSLTQTQIQTFAGTIFNNEGYRAGTMTKK